MYLYLVGILDITTHSVILKPDRFDTFEEAMEMARNSANLIADEMKCYVRERHPNNPKDYIENKINLIELFLIEDGISTLKAIFVRKVDSKSVLSV